MRSQKWLKRMISPDSLSQDQKRVLKQRYGFDVDRKRIHPQSDRVFLLLRPWIGIILMFGLFWQKPSASSAMPSQPFEIIAWIVAGFILCADAVYFLSTRTYIGRTLSDDE